MSLRVFHGLSEIAGQGYYSVKGLKELNVYTQHYVWAPNPFGYDYDITLNINLNKKIMIPIWLFKLLFHEIKAIFKVDVFHFHFGRSMLLNYDLWVYRLFKKKLYFEFHGSDLRDCILAQKINRYVYFDDNDKVYKNLYKRAKKICKYADGIIVHDDELIAHLPENHPDVYVVPLRMDINKIKPMYVNKSNDKIRIVHAPTKRIAKGSPYVIEAIEKLAKRYDIEMILVENKSQSEAFEIYKSADIIVDQLRTGTYGVFAIEGMAMGKPVITYITDEMKECLPADLPICSANPDTIEEVLEKLIKDSELRYNLGLQGRVYVEKYHDYRKNAKMLYDIYSGKLGAVQGRDAFEYASKIKI